MRDHATIGIAHASPQAAEHPERAAAAMANAEMRHAASSILCDKNNIHPRNMAGKKIENIRIYENA